MRSLLRRTGVVAALSFILNSWVALPAPALTIDGFTDPFPVNACLPNSNAPVVFTGEYCDGASCPPDSWVTCPTRQAIQTGLSGVLGGRRQVDLVEWEGATLSTFVDTGSPSLRVHFDATSDAYLTLAYGTPYSTTQDPEALNLDLVALGVSAIEFTVEGGSPTQPLLVVIELLADAPTTPRPSAMAERVVTASGLVTVALGEFVPGSVPGFTMSDVDDIQVVLSNCTDYDEGCGGKTFAAFDVRLGPVNLVTAPTPAEPTSWGRMKATYR